jgi:hypothetical protein
MQHFCKAKWFSHPSALMNARVRNVTFGRSLIFAIRDSPDRPGSRIPSRRPFGAPVAERRNNLHRQTQQHEHGQNKPDPGSRHA